MPESFRTAFESVLQLYNVKRFAGNLTNTFKHLDNYLNEVFEQTAKYEAKITQENEEKRLKAL